MSWKTRLIIASQAQSLAGDSFFWLAVLWYIGQQTGSARWVGLSTIVSASVALVAGILAGPLVDRVPVRVLMPALDWSRAVLLLAAAAAIVAHASTLAVLFATVALMAVPSVLYTPGVRKMITVLEPRSNLVRVNSNFQLVTALAGMFGFGSAGLVYVLGGPALALAIDSLTFAVAGAAMIVIAAGAKDFARTKSAPRDRRLIVDYYGNLAAGLAAVLAKAPFRNFFVIALLAVFALAPVETLSPLLVRKVLAGSSLLLALLEMAVMAGRLVGAAIARRYGHYNPLAVLQPALFGMALAAVAIGFFPSSITALVAYLTLGCGAGFSAVIIIAGLQSETPAEVQGRVLALYSAGRESLPMGGVALVSWLADSLGIRAAYLVVGALIGGLILASRWTLTMQQAAHASVRM